MSYQLDEEIVIKGRVLLAGGGFKMIDNVLEIIPRDYETVKSFSADEDFVKTLEKARPHVVVFCLQSETRETLRYYSCLIEHEKYKALPVMIIGHEDDCFHFKYRLPVRKIESFVRPLNRDGFLDTLAQFTKQSKEMKIWSALEEMSEEEETLLALQNADNKLSKRIQAMSHIHGRKSILVVDDDVMMLNLSKQYLQDLYDVTVVPSGKLALKYLAKKGADLVLLDYMMPEMDGPAVLKEIRENSPCPDVPVIFLTGVSDKDDVMRGLGLRPSGYLLKPVAKDILIERVTEAVLGLN